MLRTALLLVLTLGLCFPITAQEPNAPAAADQPQPEAKTEPKAETPTEQPAATVESPQEKPRPNTAELPWKKPAVRLPPSVKPVNTPRELLDLRGVKESEWDRTVDGQAWGDDDNELLLKVLLHFPRFSLVEVHRWQKPVEDWAKFLEQSETKRGQIIALAGHVKQIERRDLIEELVERYEYEHYFRIVFLPDGQPRACELFVRQIPSAWKVGNDLNYRMSAEALFVKRGGTEENDTAAYFAGDRCAWHPSEPQEQPLITADQVLLSAHGLDVGLLADVHEADGRPLEDFDREPMHQTLAAMKRLAPADWKVAKADKLQLAQILAAPQDHRLEFMQIGGTARRIVKVLIDEDDRERFGFDHYYEIDFFIPLGNQVIKLGADKKGAPTPEFRNDFPATLCVLELPPGLKEGEKITQQIWAQGVFYRVWSYRSQFMAKFQMTHQPAPLFIGRTVTKIESVKPALSSTDLLVIGLIGVAVLILAAIILFSGRKSSASDAELATEIRNRSPLPDKIAPPPE